MMEDIFNPYYIQVVTFILINAILGISIYITLSTGQLSLGNAGFMSLGAYTSALCTMRLDMPMVPAIFLGGVVAVLVALVIGFPTTRLQGLYLAIATLGFGEVIRVAALNMEITNGALGLSGIPSMGQEIGLMLSDWGVIDPMDMTAGGELAVVVILAVLLAVLLAGWILLERSRVGRAFAAIKADEHAAELTGIPTVYYKMMAFLLGSFVAGVAGGLYAHATFFINPTDFSYHKVVDILLFAVFGGSNVIWGPVLGAAVLTLLPEVLRFMADYREMIYGAMLIVLMAVRPDGILTPGVMTRFGRSRTAWYKKLYKKGGERHAVADDGCK